MRFAAAASTLPLTLVAWLMSPAVRTSAWPVALMVPSRIIEPAVVSVAPAALTFSVRVVSTVIEPPATGDWIVTGSLNEASPIEIAWVPSGRPTTMAVKPSASKASSVLSR